MDRPEFYSKNKNLQTTDNIYVIDKYFDLIAFDHDRSHTALDLGCGDGYTTSQILLPKLPKNVKKLIGADISENMVSFAKQLQDSRLDFHRMDIEDGDSCLEFKEAFDHVFSFYCLHWIPNQRKAFQNIHRVLKPGGDVLLSFLGTNPIFQVYESISKNIHWAPYFRSEMVSPYHNCENPADVIEKLLREIGFKECKCIVEDRRFVFENWAQLKKSVIAVNPTLPLLSRSDRIQYLQDFTKEVNFIYGRNLKLSENDNDQKIPVEYKLIIVYAKRVM
ncbi:juvenile hormone acid O-methyltransferase [Anthonomus grandis grandis]|uniref:juvenile hormone acid O-methyltransferase n=1 Tax=Anthonomus grandis grandis TaxID=2921223 RepID=UPI00216606A8|nr:juvenile hormone acid O-methyltransferase [Anthonomus grandis grandis]